MRTDSREEYPMYPIKCLWLVYKRPNLKTDRLKGDLNKGVWVMQLKKYLNAKYHYYRDDIRKPIRRF